MFTKQIRKPCSTCIHRGEPYIRNSIKFHDCKLATNIPFFRKEYSIDIKWNCGDYKEDYFIVAIRKAIGKGGDSGV